MKVFIKRNHPDAVIPKYAHSGDAGMDLTAVEVKIEKGLVKINTGICIEIPEGYVGLVFPRSSIYKTGLTLTNSVGVIDSGYRGEIMLKFTTKFEGRLYKKGDRVGQIIILPYPKIEFSEVDVLTSSERSTGGFGSSGS